MKSGNIGVYDMQPFNTGLAHASTVFPHWMLLAEWISFLSPCCLLDIFSPSKLFLAEIPLRPKSQGLIPGNKRYLKTSPLPPCQMI